MIGEQISFGFVGNASKKPDIVQILEIYSQKGKTLSFCCSKNITGMDFSELSLYCDEYDICFPDYAPKEKKGEKVVQSKTKE